MLINIKYSYESIFRIAFALLKKNQDFILEFVNFYIIIIIH